MTLTKGDIVLVQFPFTDLQSDKVTSGFDFSTQTLQLMRLLNALFHLKDINNLTLERICNQRFR